VPSGDSSLLPELTREGLPLAFGRYTLLDRLGSGGMADVFLALVSGPFDAKKLVVVKRPRATTSEYVGMFMDEARLAMRLNHPNVVQTYDAGVEQGAIFLAMEYLEGQPLQRVLAEMKRHGLSLSHGQAARIAADALAGLHYAHELSDYDGTPLRIVHRDVSPHNVFVTYEGQIKVVDFGIAKASLNQVHTEIGAVKGKLAYMAPEHARGEPVDRRSDVFTVGVILWELVAKRRLLGGTSSAELLEELLTMDFPPLSCEVPQVHPILEAIVMRALQRDPSDRYATALEMREALESYIAVAKDPGRASDLGRMVGGLFAGVREQMSTKLRAHMQANASSRSVVAAAREAGVMGTAVTSIVDMGTPVDLGPAGGDTNGPAIVTPPVAPPRREGRTAIALLLLAVSILALAAVLVVTRRSGSSDARDTAAAARGASAPPAASMSVAAAPVAAAPPAASVIAAPPPPAASPPPEARPAASSPTVASRPQAPAGGARPAASSRPASRPARPIDTSFPR
jgi:serine/threonine-protein kinase